MSNKKTAGAGTKQLGFYFDQTLCNGCKACQIACKDKHDTPLGTNWRRVVEYSGGDWSLANGVFNHDTFTYYTSIACNHCDDPICAQVCPTTAMHKGGRWHRIHRSGQVHWLPLLRMGLPILRTTIQP